MHIDKKQEIYANIFGVGYTVESHYSRITLTICHWNDVTRGNVLMYDTVVIMGNVLVALKRGELCDSHPYCIHRRTRLKNDS